MAEIKNNKEINKEIYDYLKNNCLKPLLYLETGDENNYYYFSPNTNLSPLEKKAGVKFNQINDDLYKTICTSGALEHKRTFNHLADHFKFDKEKLKDINFDSRIIKNLRKKHKQAVLNDIEITEESLSPFVDRILNSFQSFEEAYHQFILDLVATHIKALNLIMGQSSPKSIIIAGELGTNDVFIKLFNEAFYGRKIHFLIKENDNFVLKKI